MEEDIGYYSVFVYFCRPHTNCSPYPANGHVRTFFNRACCQGLRRARYYVASSRPLSVERREFCRGLLFNYSAHPSRTRLAGECRVSRAHLAGRTDRLCSARGMLCSRVWLVVIDAFRVRRLRACSASVGRNGWQGRENVYRTARDGIPARRLCEFFSELQAGALRPVRVAPWKPDRSRSKLRSRIRLTETTPVFVLHGWRIGSYFRGAWNAVGTGLLGRRPL